MTGPSLEYSQEDLVETGVRVAATTETFPLGANVSFVLPLRADFAEVYVQTCERGAGLTPSCGSGVAASRSVLSELGRVAPDLPALVRNPGGVARTWLQERDGRWQPILEGNATIVYGAGFDPDRLAGDGPLRFEGETDDAELSAFDAPYRENREVLAGAGVSPTVLSRGVWSRRPTLATPRRAHGHGETLNETCVKPPAPEAKHHVEHRLDRCPFADGSGHSR